MSLIRCGFFCSRGDLRCHDGQNNVMFLVAMRTTRPIDVWSKAGDQTGSTIEVSMLWAWASRIGRIGIRHGGFRPVLGKQIEFISVKYYLNRIYVHRNRLSCLSKNEIKVPEIELRISGAVNTFKTARAVKVKVVSWSDVFNRCLKVAAIPRIGGVGEAKGLTSPISLTT